MLTMANMSQKGTSTRNRNKVGKGHKRRGLILFWEFTKGTEAGQERPMQGLER